jgi:hypothetical protein
MQIFDILKKVEPVGVQIKGESDIPADLAPAETDEDAQNPDERSEGNIGHVPLFSCGALVRYFEDNKNNYTYFSSSSSSSSSNVPHNAHDIRYPDTDKKEHPAELMPAESETEKKD